MQYGVQREHYGLVGRIVLEVIEEEFGKDYTPGVGTAWKEVIDTVFRYMLEDIP